MRQAVAKTVRRDIRRACGADALEVIDQQGVMLETHAGLISHLRAELAALHREQKKFNDAAIHVAGHQDGRLKDLEQDYAFYKKNMNLEWLAMSQHLHTLLAVTTFWERLRWFVTGR